MSKDNNVSITPTTRNFGVNGGGNAIIVSGSSATWTAAASDPWITLNTTSGNVGYPVAYTVSANTNVEQRTGYVYVSGWVHTVTQDGVGGTISPENKEVECQGGSGTITVTAANKMVWQARPNVDWLSVTPTSGAGEGSVTYQVAPYNEVATRQGTLTVAGNTFTVFQYGRRMKLSTYNETRNYETHVIPITVNALAITQWSVTPNNSWISVVDAGNGQGGDLVTIAIAENPSYKARTGTVTIGTETFTVTQQGRPTAALSFSVSPTASTASVNGANGTIAVTATPDLPWTATSGANWITVYAATATGAGNGNVVYSASPNPTLSQRTGNITVTPEAASGMAAKTHKVTQPAAQSALSSNGYEFEATGESCSVDVSVANIVQWSISESLDWITVNGSTSRTGPGTVVLQASANNTIYPRSGTVKIAGKNFSVSQKARGVELEYDTKLFDTDGGMDSISIHPDGNSSWTAVASDTTWITIFQGDSGTGDGEIMYVVSPYVGDGTARTGWITVGSQKVYITQRAYDLNIDPNGTNVVGNAGAGEFGVTAEINDVWTAIVTEPWITLVSGYDAGTGSGTVRFIYTENTTGKTRTGKIIVAGEVYTLEQRARQMVAITATAEHGGTVSGGGSYDLGTQVTLTAVPDSGYKFSYWTGAVSSMQNPLTVTVDVAKSYTAVFEPLPIAFTSVVSDATGVTLSWNNLAWAGTYRIYRGVTSVPSSAIVLAELQNSGNCTYLDTTGDVDVMYWYWIEAEGPSDDVMSDPMTGYKEKPIVISPITYTNLRGASNPNPATYQEGTLVTFANPGAVTGYTFSGWTPSQITAEMTGAQTVCAAWTANGYSIAYNPNGGSGTMEPTAATYDSETTVASNGFTWARHVFMGWATNATGEVVYLAGQPVTNLTAQSSGVVTLYAVWETAAIATPVISPTDGATFSGDSCTVTITCATEGATIYYSTNGRTPRFTETNRYTGPFTITDTTTVIAVAVSDDQEEYAEATITKVGTPQLTLSGVLDAANLASVTTGGDAEWTPVDDASAKVGGSCAQSGTVGMEQSSHLEVAVQGKGTLTFWWKVSCEPDPRGRHTYDNLSFAVDGTDVAWIDGETGWAQQSVTFDTTGAHTIRWTYATDDWEEPGYSDCGWVDGVVWTPEGGVVVDPLPEIASDSEVTNALAGAGDEARLTAHISGKVQYDLFRAWVDAKGLDHQTVKNSSRAWFSYAIGANGLVEKVFQKDDVTICSLETLANGSLSFEVDVKGVMLGTAATSENLATVFGIQGTVSLKEGSFSSRNVTVTLGVSANGRLLVTATPNRTSGSFFIRARMHPDDDADDDTNGGEDGEPAVDPVTATCTIIFDANGGTGDETRYVLAGEQLGTLPTVERDGYDFDNWWTAAIGGTQVIASTIASENETYYAHWMIKTYSVTFDANGGVGGTTTTRTYGATVGTLPMPTREGYTFDGWFTEANGGTQVSAATIVSAAVIYYAHWTEVISQNSSQTYCVIDLSAGANASSYAVSYLDDVPAGGWTDEHKTTKLVLRRIEPGSFMMCGQYNVMLTKPFYIGVFEMTQKQYELVTGAKPSTYKGDNRPVTSVSWDKIRGNSSTNNWPSIKTVDAASFMGKLRTRTGLDFDLPTEAQWEYACRAGTTSDFNNGGSSENDLKQLGRYSGNTSDGKGGYSQHTTVGLYQPNAWGIYDMHGNVAEWCLDICHDDFDNNVTDPVGPYTGSGRVVRSGHFGYSFEQCTSSTRWGDYSRNPHYDFGFRLAMTSVDYSEYSTTLHVDSHNKVQLWEGGPYWATTNIGAENPEDYGYYFWWGDVVGYKWENNAWVTSDGSSANFSFKGENTPTYGVHTDTLQSNGWITAENVLVSEHDAAHVHWGGDWRMPTEQELDDLNSNCDWTLTTENGVNGYLVRGRGDYASNSIFLPCAGVGNGNSLNSAGSYGTYWSSVPRPVYSYAWYHGFDANDHGMDYDERYSGRSVRPVQGSTR